MDGELAELRRLHNSIAGCAQEAFEVIAPRYVSVFSDTIEQSGDFPRAMEAVRYLPLSPRIGKWRDLCIAVADVQVTVHELRLGRELLRSPAPKGMSTGEWVYYHLDAWYVLLLGLLDRATKLAKKTARAFVSDGVRREEVLAMATQGLKRKKQEVWKTRGRVGQAGGPVEVIGRPKQVLGYVLYGVDPIGAISSIRWPLTRTSGTSLPECCRSAYLKR